jgi:choline dehydrogenase
MANPPTSYDYIVIGAGSAGSIVAAGLAASKKAPSVLLLEAGKDAKDVKELWDPNYINSLYEVVPENRTGS